VDGRPPASTDEVHAYTRRLRSRCEAIYGAVFRAPEYRSGALGLDQLQWYMAGRSSALGETTAPVATALFGTFDPRRVQAGLDGVWSITTPEAVRAAWQDSAVAVLVAQPWAGPAEASAIDTAVALLERGLGAAEAAGHPLFAALAARPPAADRLARLWQLCELVREHRSAAHVNAWRAAGLDPAAVTVLDELWRDLPRGSIAHVDMGWSRGDIDAALRRLVDAGLADDGRITPAGRERRDGIERATGRQQSSIVDAVGDDGAALLALLDPWARATASA
jgi:hypothetical protein